MKKSIIILIFINCFYTNIYTQNTLCAGADPFCTGTIYSIPALVNSGNAEVGPDYGCLSSVLNPTWYYLLADVPGNIILDIHSSTGDNLDYICWGPFTSQTGPCTVGLTSSKIVDCGNNISNQEWCNIPNVHTGEYYIVVILNNSNAVTNIIINQDNAGQAGAGNTNCSICCGCGFANISYTVNPCNPSSNLYSLSGSVFFTTNPPPQLTGFLIVYDLQSGMNQNIPAPFYNGIPFYIDSLPSDGTQHSLFATFSEDTTCIFAITYTAPDTCNICNINAGNNMQVCGLTTTLNAIENISDVNTHWLPLSGINFGSINSPTSAVTAIDYGIYNLVWQVTNNSGLTCTDSLTIEFIDPALCTSVFEKKNLDNFNIFPNPAINGIFTIKYSSKVFDKYFIKITNSQGIEVFRKSISKYSESIEITIDSNKLINGYYLVEINDGQKILRKPVIIQNIYNK